MIKNIFGLVLAGNTCNTEQFSFSNKMLLQKGIVSVIYLSLGHGSITARLPSKSGVLGYRPVGEPCPKLSSFFGTPVGLPRYNYCIRARQ